MKCSSLDREVRHVLISAIAVLLFLPLPAQAECDPWILTFSKLSRDIHAIARRYTPLLWYASWAKYQSARAQAIGKEP